MGEGSTCEPGGAQGEGARVTSALRVAYPVPPCLQQRSRESLTLKPKAIFHLCFSPGHPAMTTEVSLLSFSPQSGFRDLKLVAFAVLGVFTPQRWVNAATELVVKH